MLRDIGKDEEFIESLPDKVEAGEFTIYDLVDLAKEVVDAGVAKYGFVHRPNVGPDFQMAMASFGIDRYDDEQGKLQMSESRLAAFFDWLKYAVLERPVLIRLETDGDWFDGRHGERRVGGRIALAATLRIAGTPVTLANVHLESHSDPAHRGDQIGRLLAALERYAPGQPAVIGGDLNTVTSGRAWARATGVRPELPAERLADPVPYEPLFEVAARAGYDWRTCNALAVPTQRTRPDGTPRPPLGRLDWFLCRGLEASAPATLPAVDDRGYAISDHEILAVTVRPAR